MARMTGLNAAFPFLNLARVIVEMGAEVLIKVFDFRIDVRVCLPNGVEDDYVTLFHGVMPTLRTEFGLFVTPGNTLGFVAKAMDSRFVRLMGRGPEDVSKPFWVTAKHRVTSDLKSRFALMLNGDRVAELYADVLAVSGEMTSYERLFGGVVGAEIERNTPLTMLSVLVARSDPPSGDGELKSYFAQLPSPEPCVLMKANGGFRFKKGETTGVAEGECVFLDTFENAYTQLDKN